MKGRQGAIDLLSFSFALSAMIVTSFWSFLSLWDSATGVPAHIPLILLPRRTKFLHP